MAKFTGSALICIIGSTTVTANEIIDIDYEWTNDKTENTGAGDTHATHLTTITHFTFTVNGYSDSTGTAASGTLRKAIADIQAQADHIDTFDIRPFGTTAGRRKITGSAHLDSFSEPVGYNDNALCSATFTATGTVTDTTQ